MPDYVGNLADAFHNYGQTIMAKQELALRQQELAQHQQQIDMEHQRAQLEAHQAFASMLGSGAHPVNAQGNVSMPAVPQSNPMFGVAPGAPMSDPSVGNSTVPADQSRTLNVDGKNLELPTQEETFQRTLGQEAQTKQQNDDIDLQRALHMRDATYVPLPSQTADQLHLPQGTKVDPSKIPEYENSAAQQIKAGEDHNAPERQAVDTSARYIAQKMGIQLDPNKPALTQLPLEAQLKTFQLAKETNADPETRNSTLALKSAATALMADRAAAINQKLMPNHPTETDPATGKPLVVNPIAQLIANGKLDPTATRRYLVKDKDGSLIRDVLKVDPGFDMGNIDNRYTAIKEYSNTSNAKAGGQINALNTLIHHADLYQKSAEALKNGTFVPGNAVYNAVASTFGSAPPTNAKLAARFLAGETGKVATGGVPAEGEINGILANMSTNGSPESMKQAGDTLLSIAAGRYLPLKERAEQAKIDKIVPLLGPDAQSILKSRGYDLNTLKPVQAGTKVGSQPSFSVGQKVKIKGGKQVTITAVHPDGTFDAN